MISSNKLPFVPSWHAQQRLMEGRIRELAEHSNHLDILEAGCGQNWNIDLEGIEYSLTGLDIDSAALSIRKSLFNDLDRIIEGDLRDVELDSQSFDVIYNGYVLEHVDGAEMVMNNFVKWLKPGGIIILKIPDPDSVKGFITRITPHWFHIVYFRYVLGIDTAGKPGHAPYRTFFDPIVSRKGIHKFCLDNDLIIVDEYKNGLTKPNGGLRLIIISMVSKFLQILSFGRLSARHQNLLYILRRKNGPEEFVFRSPRVEPVT